MEVTTYDLATIDYQQAADLQLDLAARIAAGTHPPALLLLEHPHVYTFGRQGHPENLLWDPSELARRGITIHHSDRGGDVTYHGPGQLVGYPLIPLGETGTLEYLRGLETALIQALADFGISAVTIAGQTGVWVPASAGQPPAKIASIGVRVDAQRITRHGFALNVSPNMAYWQGIIACGLENQAQTSLAELVSPAPEMTSVRRSVCAAMADVFGWRLRPANPDSKAKPGKV